MFGFYSSFSWSIVGGEPVQENEFPFAVSICSDGAYFGGSLIGDRIILTAAHSVVPISKDKIDNMKVSIGSSNHIEFANQENIHRIVSCVIHEEYNCSTLEHDIAVLVLKDKVDFPIVRLFNQEKLTQLKKDMPAAVVGWGLTDEDSPFSIAETLQVLHLSYLPNHCVSHTLESGREIFLEKISHFFEEIHSRNTRSQKRTLELALISNYFFDFFKKSIKNYDKYLFNILEKRLPKNTRLAKIKFVDILFGSIDSQTIVSLFLSCYQEKKLEVNACIFKAVEYETRKTSDCKGIIFSNNHFRGNRDAQGDSGSPLLVKTDEGIYEQIGIVSHSLAIPHIPFGCYTNVSQYIDWVSDKKDTLCS